MFFPLGVDPEAYRRVIDNNIDGNKNKRVKLEKRMAELEKRMAELQKSMNDYLESLANHPRISFSGMMYYGHLNSEFLKLKKEYDSNNISKNVKSKSESMKLRSRSDKQQPKPILNENTRKLRKRTHVNYKV